jgi:hypothetical protein
MPCPETISARILLTVLTGLSSKASTNSLSFIACSLKSINRVQGSGISMAAQKPQSRLESRRESYKKLSRR